jgi:hypothetical protein
MREETPNQALKGQRRTKAPDDPHTACKTDLIGWIHWIAQEHLSPNLAKIEDKRKVLKEPFHPLCILVKRSHPRRAKATIIKEKHTRRRRQTSKEEVEIELSSGCKLSMEDRLKAMEEELKRIKHYLHNQDDFLQNVHVEAGRRLEILEADITTTKLRFSEELGQIRQEHKDPKKEFEEQVNKLESQMEKLNQDWQLERGFPKKEAPRKFGQ